MLSSFCVLVVCTAHFLVLVDAYAKSTGYVKTTSLTGEYYMYDLTVDPTEDTNLVTFDATAYAKGQTTNTVSSEYQTIYDHLLDYTTELDSAAIGSLSLDYLDGVSVYQTFGHYWPWEDNSQEENIIGNDVSQLYNMESSTIIRKAKQQETPNIVFIMVDDLGWNDVNFGTDSTFIPWGTPAITSYFKEEGMILTNYYSSALCTPARGSFLTGKYPSRIGMDGVFSSLPETEITIAQEMKSAGYSTAMLGKWGVGYDMEDKLPWNRGFDKFYGYLNTQIDHRAKTVGSQDIMQKLGYTGSTIDWFEDGEWIGDKSERVNSKDDADMIGYLLQDKAELYIKEFVKMQNSGENENPFFLYYSSNLPHSPFDAPSVYTDRCIAEMSFKTVSESDEQDVVNYCGMILQLDEVVSNLTCVLKEQGIYDNTLMLLVSDNGGEVDGSNLPYKAKKSWVLEGGVHVPAAIGGGYLPSSLKGTIYDGMFHVSDWLPTLMNIGTSQKYRGSYLTTSLGEENEIDGIDQSVTMQLFSGKGNVRSEMPVVFDKEGELSSVYMVADTDGHMYKLMYGTKMGDASKVSTRLVDTSSKYTGDYICQISSGFDPIYSEYSEYTKKWTQMNVITAEKDKVKEKVKEKTHKATSFLYHVLSGASAILIFLVLGKIALYLAYTKMMERDKYGEVGEESEYGEEERESRIEDKERLLQGSQYGAFTI